MSFRSLQLSVLSYSNGFTLWHYKTPDSLNTVLGEGYFNSGTDMLRKGDLIITNADNEENPINVQIFIKSSKDGVVVATQYGS